VVKIPSSATAHNAMQSIMRIFARNVRRQLSIAKPITCHVFRHSIATHFLAGGVDIRYIQVFLGHADLTTTEIYTHVEPVHLAEELLRAHPRDRMKIPLNKAE
jgi:site-specific recombinase XerD